jgi:hypothetical protein
MLQGFTEIEMDIESALGRREEQQQALKWRKWIPKTGECCCNGLQRARVLVDVHPKVEFELNDTCIWPWLHRNRSWKKLRWVAVGYVAPDARLVFFL